MKKTILATVVMCLVATAWVAAGPTASPLTTAPSPATVTERSVVYTTYPFSDPDPVADRGKIYPYFRFEGFTDTPESREWRVVVLENDFISVTVMPQIGGKVWGATDKKTGKPFIYDNGVVKFRDIALRGPWTSGGIEFNYGVIGHSPTTSHPVDYLTRQNDDGSASCIVRMLDLMTRTTWSVEVRLPADKAWFETNSFWHNGSELSQPYYNWANSAVNVSEELEFVYPGTMSIGHGGTVEGWPLDNETGRDISTWRGNDFGDSKSYHIAGTHDKYFGTWWPESSMGMVHYSERDAKPGKKLFLWALSDAGGIWEDLLTDDTGQYVEMQSGRLFNQNTVASVLTPHKQIGFAPYGTDVWREYWYPYHGTGGVADATLKGVVNLREAGDGGGGGGRRGTEIIISPVGVESGVLEVFDRQGRSVDSRRVDFTPGEPVVFTVPAAKSSLARITLGQAELWTGDDRTLSRPSVAPRDFDWESALGQWTRGQYLVWLRDYAGAEPLARRSVELDPDFIPGHNLAARISIHRMDYRGALDQTLKALAVDTYDGEANYLMGYAAQKLGRVYDAMDGFEIAALSAEYRGAALTALARIHLGRDNAPLAEEYAAGSIAAGAHNISGLKLLYLARAMQDKGAEDVLAKIEEMDPLNEFARFERYCADPSPENREAFRSMIRGEMVVQSYLELAVWYNSVGLEERARGVLELSPGDAETAYWMAWLARDREMLARADSMPVEFVFPFREESVPALEWAAAESGSWKSAYLLALIHYSRGNDARALELLDGLGNEPDFAPLYVTRAELTSEAAQREADLT
ncbi:MAG: DUF5107 domain-containing protein, partial [Alistipes sp.]|nr:DUF5107 domain-containing protein [Alistipes sp.]